MIEVETTIRMVVVVVVVEMTPTIPGLGYRIP